MSITVKTQNIVGKKIVRLSGEEVKVESVGARGYKVEGERKQIPAKSLMMHDRKLHEIDHDVEVDEDDVRSTEKGYLQMKTGKSAQYVEKPKGKSKKDSKQETKKQSTKKGNKLSKADAMIERFMEEVSPKWLRENYEELITELGVDLEGDGSTSGEYTEKSSKLRKLRISFLINSVFDEEDWEFVLEQMIAKDLESLLAAFVAEDEEDEEDEDLLDDESDEDEEDEGDEEDESDEDEEDEGDEEDESDDEEEEDESDDEEEDEVEEIDLDEMDHDELVDLAVSEKVLSRKKAKTKTEKQLRRILEEALSAEEEEDDEEIEEAEYEEVDEQDDAGENLELADIEGDGFIPDFVYPKHPLIVVGEDGTAELDLSGFTENDTDQRAKGNKYKELAEILNVVHGMSSTALRSVFTKMFSNVSDMRVQVSNTMQGGKRGIRFDVGVLFDAPTAQSALVTERTLGKVCEKVTESEKFAKLVESKLGFDWSANRNQQLTDEDMDIHFILVGATKPIKGKVKAVLQIVGHDEYITPTISELENFVPVEEFDYYSGEMCDLEQMTRRQIIEYMQAHIVLTPEEVANYEVIDYVQLIEEANTLLSKIFTDEDEVESFGSVGNDDEDLDADFDSDDDEDEDEDDDDLLDDEEEDEEDDGEDDDDDEDLDDLLADFDDL